jgi:hypothetical protein
LTLARKLEVSTMVEKGGLDPVFQALYCGAMLSLFWMGDEA